MGERGIGLKGRLLRLWGGLPIPRFLRWWIVLAAARKFPVGVIAAVVDDDGRLLLFRHTYRGRYPWGLPSGWLEPGEQPESGIVREIREETGLEACDPSLLLVRSAEDARRLDLVYTAKLNGGTFRASSEVTGLHWFDRGELPEMMPSQYDMIQEIFRAVDKKK
jgi:ADP-ribose pyrophosphatase YjhB (NUDIX family)